MAPPTKPTGSLPLEVVVLGASAGGLEPTSRLLKAVPPDTGLAFVVIEHLDPSYASQLPQILARTTSMPVASAAEGAALEPDHIYVITPGVFLGIEAGRFHLQPRPEKAPHLPIDFFCRQLAADRGVRSIGVILSGTGADGTLGLKAIKCEGGITFAQDDTAEHKGMPHSAVAAGVADFVLPPEEIAAELARIAAHPYLREEPPAEEPPPPQAEDAYASLFRLLLAATRVDYANYKRSTVERRIQRRMLVHRKDRVEDYVAFVRAHPAEVQALHHDLSINVTRFFRDPEVFAALETSVFPALLAERSDDAPLRIWIPGCATGEEAYSIAMCLFESLDAAGVAAPLRIFATDVSEPALARARAGVFPEGVAADISPERLARFFVRTSDGLAINKAIREACVFARHDVTRDPPFSNIDLVSCRNVLIYLGPLLQRRVFSLFHYALAPRRFLLLGKSETPVGLPDLYEAVDLPNRIYRATGVETHVSFDFGAGGAFFADETPPPRSRPDAPEGRNLLREVDRVLLAKYAPPGVVVDDALEIIQFRGETTSFLAPAPGTATLNLLRMAREGLVADLKSAIEDAKATGRPARRDNVPVTANGRTRVTDLQVVPMQVAGKSHLAVLFEDASAPAAGHAPPAETPGAASPALRSDGAERLREELAATKDHLQSSIEALEGSNQELAATNEEVVSSNEELQSTNEELQTAKEELQASNEELNTVNDELRLRNVEATRLGDALAALLSSVSIPIVMVGGDLRIRRFTPSAAELLSLIESDVGRPISDIAPKLEGVQLAPLMQAVLESLAPLEREAVDAAGRWHRLTVRPYRTGDNRIDGAVLTVIDIDAVKRAAEELRAARNDAEAILGAVHVPLVVLDERRRIVEANAAFFRFFQLPPSGGGPWSRGDAEMRSLEIPALTRLLDENFRAGGALEKVEVRREFAGVGYRAVAISSHPLTLAGAKGRLALVAIEDITQHDEAMKVLRQEKSSETLRIEALGRLAGGVAHDFNNLMTIVNGYSETLMGLLGAGTTEGDMAREILHAGNRAAALTRQLLAYGRKQIFQLRDVDLNDLIRDSMKLLGPLLGGGVNLHLLLRPGRLRVRIDPTQTERVLMDLCVNARDATGGRGNVHIETASVDVRAADGGAGLAPVLPPGRYARLTVRDDGCGMTEETAVHVFEPFFTTKEFGKGSGLGLAAVQGIVKQSNGQIDVSSRPGKGAEFRILLPLVSAAEPDAPPLADVAPRPGAAPTILVVEDEEALRRLVKTCLSGLGYHVLEAPNGAEALRLVGQSSSRVDLLVTDVVMPGMTGPELAAQLLSMRPGLEMIFVSGYPEATVDARMPAGARFLPKPFSLEELQKAVRELLPPAA